MIFLFFEQTQGKSLTNLNSKTTYLYSGKNVNPHTGDNFYIKPIKDKDLSITLLAYKKLSKIEKEIELAATELSRLLKLEKEMFAEIVEMEKTNH